jgi:hypothetical protein
VQADQLGNPGCKGTPLATAFESMSEHALRSTNVLYGYSAAVAGVLLHSPVHREVCPALVALQGFLKPPLADVTPGTGVRWVGCRGGEVVQGGGLRAVAAKLPGCSSVHMSYVPGISAARW